MLARRLDATGNRLDLLDREGPRGMAVLAVQVTQLAADLATHEQAHTDQARQRRADIWRLVAVLVALIAPVYPLLLLRR